MAKIYYVQDKDGNTVYPVTHADAILGLEDVNVDLSAYQTKTDNNLATQSKDLVGAINELFQSADSGKELIANAIGEPVSADDTFSAMSNDINSLLSTFKTNMMNNGIAVGANDKFKQLIDKISTMAEEGQGKGIQFIQGEHVLSELLYTNNANITINTNLSFNPNYIIVYIPNITPLSIEYTNQPDVVLTTDCRRMEITGWYGTEYEYRGPSFELSYTRDTINIKVSRGVSGYNPYMPAGTAIKWYAIGVGEEDTTLRDSLADILESNGVDVTENDDMAGLIGKVDQELNRINAETSIIKTGTATITNLYSSAGTFTVNINPGFVPKEIICTIKSFQFNYTSGSYTTIDTPTVVYSKYNNTASKYVTISPRNGNYGTDVYISSISQSNFVVTITRFTGYSMPSMSIEWTAIS